MTDNEKKAREIASKDPCQVWIGGCPNVYAAAMEMAKYKDDAIDVLNGQNEALEAQLKKARAANVEFFDNVKRLEAENAKLKQKLSELQTAVCDWGETEDILNG